MKADKRGDEEPFVSFGPEQARQARQEAGLPEPRGADVPPDAGLLRRLWAFLTGRRDEHRKLWLSDSAR